MKSLQEYTRWKKELGLHTKANVKKSIWQLINTLVPFVLLWVLAYMSLSVSIWISLALAIPAAGFVVRTFIIFHDCCHLSFFSKKKTNAIVGTITGILTFFPYEQWKNEHSIHHATSGNLNLRGTGDIWTLTTDEYIALSPWRRLGYRLYRNPLVLFGLGPIFIFLVAYRLNRKNAKRKERINTYITNAALIAMMVVLCLTLGWKEVLIVEGTILYLAGAAGIWLFYVQHQFEDTYYERAEDWDFVSAAMEGSSYYKLPKLMQWMTGNIGFHHIHHLDPQVTNYNLERLHNSSAALQNVPAIGIRLSLQALSYRLWDEGTKRYVGFNYLKRKKYAGRPS
ncbi:omega-6 fatty acid desaturase (delta-12 desaturase) [Paenibacillus shirakamiensis]|uniref:Omega-6 fatty acid desaturase (Delta-12 desaturase) n=1 Tax=Paenibacillus shirakamiensis TaxID=1265935 RepID=A0ABS4JEP7_9BACL|nr:fatty acid desaturase [Paenibacillus shirakamiensis]MBP2000187.1 omega-6 fatty acid desaturase (delta-12 desaturase) [Paenibacillus shirakamiensis]